MRLSFWPLLGLPGCGADKARHSDTERRDSSSSPVPEMMEIVGQSAGNRLGRAAAAGDFDGDGQQDLALGAYAPDKSESMPGRVLVFSGAGLATAEAQVLDTPDQTLGDGDLGSELGIALSAADLDGDGLTDLAAGAPGTEDGRGAVALFLGSTGGLPETPDRTLAGSSERERFGTTLALDDWTADGACDLAVGAPEASSEVGDLGAGRVDLYLDVAAGASEPTVRYPGGTASLRLGAALATLGDVTGDGLHDLGAGTKIAFDIDSDPFEIPTEAPGELHILAGDPESFGTSATAVIRGDDSLDGFGVAAVGVGDLDGDGTGDLVVSEGHYYYQFVDGADDADRYGRVYLFHGGATLTGELGVSDAAQTWTSDQRDGGFGFALSAPGDLNGDGQPELLVSAPGANDGGGSVTMYSGLATAPILSWYFDMRVSYFGEATLALATETPGCVWVVSTAYLAYPDGDGDLDRISTEDVANDQAAGPSDEGRDQAGAAFLIPMCAESGG